MIKPVGVRSGLAEGVMRFVRVDMSVVLESDGEVRLPLGRSSSGARVKMGLAGEGSVEPGAELLNRPRRG
jgi:hypothetical protein